MAGATQLSSSFVPFPDCSLPANLAPVAEEVSAVASTVADSGRDDQNRAGGETRRISDDATVPPAKRRRVIYLCETCGTYYTEKRALARHRHTNTHRRNVGLPPALKYSCTICSKEFSRDHDRQRHEKEKHHGLKRSGARYPKPERSPAADSVVGSAFDDSATSQFGIQVKFKAESPSLSEEPSRSGSGSGSGDAQDPATSATRIDHPSQVDASPRDHNQHGGPDVTGLLRTTQTLDESLSALGSSMHRGDPHERSWFADSDDEDEEPRQDSDTKENQEEVRQHDEGEGEGEGEDVDVDDQIFDGTSMSQYSSRTGSTAADSGIDMTQDGQHEAKFPTITTYDYRKNSVESQENPDTRAMLEGETKVGPLPRPHATVIQRRGKPITIPASKALLCVFCDKAFEDDCRDLLPHLRQHLDMFTSETPCRACKISFVHKEDLERHQSYAEVVGHCGFNFGHRQPCTGHHPPEQDVLEAGLSDLDSFRLCVQLRDWEQAQLRAYISNIRDLVALQTARSSQAYSIDALFRRSRDSWSSFAVSVKTLGSAPCDETSSGKRDIGGLQQRMKMMSISKSQVRHTAKKLPAFIRSGGINKGLYNAASAGDVQQIERLVKLGADLSATVHGQTILSAAAEHANIDTVKCLNKLGANVNADDPKHGSALGSAAFAGNLAVVEHLLMLGADIEQPSEKHGCPLSAAAAGGNLASVNLLLDRGASIDQEGGLEGCPLGFAVWNDRFDAVKLLLESGADINHAGGQHGNALCAAIIRLATDDRLPAFVRFLVECGANVNQQGRTGTALRIAASHADVPAMGEVVKLLLARGAAVDTPSQPTSVLTLAKKQRQYWIDKRPTVIMFDERIEEHITCCDRVLGMLSGAGAEDDASRSQSITSSRRPSKESRH